MTGWQITIHACMAIGLLMGLTVFRTKQVGIWVCEDPFIDALLGILTGIILLGVCGWFYFIYSAIKWIVL